MRWKLVAKQVNPDGNVIDVGLVWENGNTEIVARIVFPNDRQICENVKCTEAIIKILRARLRSSV